MRSHVFRVRGIGPLLCLRSWHRTCLHDPVAAHMYLPTEAAVASILGVHTDASLLERLRRAVCPRGGTPEEYDAFLQARCGVV